MTDQKVFRWLNFGTCLFRIAFDTPAFHGAPYLGLPVQVSKIWRREISALMSDWDTSSGFSESLPPSLFSETWLSSRAIFEQADVVLVDLVLDIFQPHCLRFRRPGETGGITYDHIVSNFPDEPPAGLEGELGAFDCDEAISLRAWERYGEELKTPTVFVTMENRDDIRSGYSEDFRQKLLHYQAGIAELAKRFPHWLVVSVDDIFADVGKEAYIDRHHPTPLGWKLLRERLPKLIEQSGIIRAGAGGAPLPMRNWNIPERCDFVALDTNHIAHLVELGGSACAVGPERLAGPARAAFGPALVTHESFSPLSGKPSPSLMIILRWNQPADIPPWLTGLVKQHPGTLIEILSLWRGRENNMLGEPEKSLRISLKAFGDAHREARISLSALPQNLGLYVARCLLQTHRFKPERLRVVPCIENASKAPMVVLPAVLAEQLKTLELLPVFGPHS